MRAGSGVLSAVLLPVFFYEHYFVLGRHFLFVRCTGRQPPPRRLVCVTWGAVKGETKITHFSPTSLVFCVAL